MKHGSLFSGIGGFDLAAERVGFENIFQVEIDKFCQKVLEKNFPNVKRFSDIKDFDGTEYRNRIDIISGGFPCQPFSIAGKRQGKEDNRYLWDEMLRVIGEVKPPWVVGENVANLWNMGIENMFIDLENEGYEVEPFIIPACAIQAPHRRDRIWIIANTDKIRGGGIQGQNQILYNGIRDSKGQIKKREVFSHDKIKHNDRTSANPHEEHIKELERGDKLGYESEEKAFRRSIYDPDWNRHWVEVASELCRVDDGLPKELDKTKRIGSLGNAIVPQIAEIIFNLIKEINYD